MQPAFLTQHLFNASRKAGEGSLQESITPFKDAAEVIHNEFPDSTSPTGTFFKILPTKGSWSFFILWDATEYVLENQKRAPSFSSHFCPLVSLPPSYCSGFK